MEAPKYLRTTIIRKAIESEILAVESGPRVKLCLGFRGGVRGITLLVSVDDAVFMAGCHIISTIECSNFLECSSRTGKGGKSRSGSDSAYERPKRTVRVPITLRLTVQGLLNFKSLGHNKLAS